MKTIGITLGILAVFVLGVVLGAGLMYVLPLGENHPAMLARRNPATRELERPADKLIAAFGEDDIAFVCINVKKLMLQNQTLNTRTKTLAIRLDEIAPASRPVGAVNPDSNGDAQPGKPAPDANSVAVITEGEPNAGRTTD